MTASNGYLRERAEDWGCTEEATVLVRDLF